MRIMQNVSKTQEIQDENIPRTLEIVLTKNLVIPSKYLNTN